MTTRLFTRSDYKRLAAGVGVAAMTGLLFGAAMQPNLRGPLDSEGPQMFVGLSGVRAVGGHDPGLGFTSYQGQIPDYVIGTDWLRPPEMAETYVPPPPEAESEVWRVEEAPADASPVVARQEPDREPVRYPSLDGGAAYGQPREPARAEAPAPQDDDLAEMAATTPG